MKFFPISSNSVTATATPQAFNIAGRILRVLRDSSSVAICYIGFSNDAGAQSVSLVLGNDKPKYFDTIGWTKVWFTTVLGTADANFSFSPYMGEDFTKVPNFGSINTTPSGVRNITSPTIGGDMLICRDELFITERLFFKNGITASDSDFEILGDTIINVPFGSRISFYSTGAVTFSYGILPK